jgi:hypothetical protein
LYDIHLFDRRLHPQVYRAAAAYVETRDARGGGGGGGGRLSGEERRAVWGSCRFAFCSAEVQASLRDRAYEKLWLCFPAFWPPTGRCFTAI